MPIDRTTIAAVVAASAFSTAFVYAVPSDACVPTTTASAHQTVEESPPDDLDPPSGLSVDLEKIKRVQGRGSNQPQGLVRSSCDDLGWVVISIDPYSESWGYRTEVVDGAMPERAIPPWPVQTNRDELQFTWHEDAEHSKGTLDATIRVTPVDKWGREGEPSDPLTIHDASPSDAACTTAGSQPPPGSAILVLILILVPSCWYRRTGCSGRNRSQ